MDFGVLSTAGIAQKAFLPAVQASDHNVIAIASRRQERGQLVADEYEIEHVYDGYGQLLEDAPIDAVYIPLPNALHAEWTKAAADAGVDVLCEKPLAVDTRAARELVEYCEQRDVTLMEGYMYQYHPRTERALEIADEHFDTIRSVTSSFKFSLTGRPDDIRLSPKLDGGSLMDVGCYPVSVARQFLGEPSRAYAHTDDSRDSGVDTELAGILEYASGASARIASGFDTQKVQYYRVEAGNGWLEVHNAFDVPADEPLELEYQVDGRHAVETFDPTDQYRLEIDHFASCVENGETPRTDGTEAVANMAVMDALYQSADDGTPVDIGAAVDVDY